MNSNSKDGPLVTVGLTTRNRVHLLARALDSLLNQTYRNIELIVSDNGSTDGTKEMAPAYAERDSRIHYVRHDGAMSGLDNLAFTVKEARGKYFMWASDDDSWEPLFIEKLVEALEKNPEYASAMSYYYEKRVGNGKEEIILCTHNYTNLSNRELFKMYMRARKRPTFLFALYRTSIRKKMEIPYCFNGIYLFLAEAALAGRAYSVPMPLFTWLNDLRPTQVRHAGDPYTEAQLTKFAITKYMLLVPVRLLKSSVIPWYRKLLIFGPWLRRLWHYKRKIFKEFLIKRG